MSMRSGSSQRNTGSVQSSGRKQIRVTSSFPLLEPYDIVACLENCDLSITEETITRPTPQSTQILFEQIADNFCNTTRQILQPKVNGCVAGRDDAVQMANLLTMLALHRSLCKFMQVCDIKGFSLADIQKPEAPRIQRILSAVVNYARFRGELREVIVDVCQEGESHMIRYHNLLSQIETTKAQILIHQREATANQIRLREVEQHNKAVEDAMKQLWHQSDKLRAENEQYKRERTILAKRVKDDLEEITKLNQEIETDESYLSYSPEEFEHRVSRLRKDVEDSKTTIKEMEDRIGDLMASVVSLNVIKKELTLMLKDLEESKAELRLEEKQFSDLEDVRESYDAMKMELESLEARVEISQQYLISTNEDVERINATSEAQRKELDDEIARLKENFNLCQLEIKIGQQDINKKKEYVKKVEGDMVRLRLKWDEQFQDMMKRQEKLYASVDQNRARLLKANNTL